MPGMTAGEACFEESGGECLAAKRTVKAEGRNLSACGAGRAGALLAKRFLGWKGDPGTSPG